MVQFDNTLGALLVSLMLSLTLYGITIVQAYAYYTTYRVDRWHIKYLFGKGPIALTRLSVGLFILPCLDSIFISHASYTLLVTYSGEPASLMTAFENSWSISLNVRKATILVTYLTEDQSVVAFLSQLSQGMENERRELVAKWLHSRCLTFMRFLRLFSCVRPTCFFSKSRLLAALHKAFTLLVAIMCFLENGVFGKLDQMMWILLVPFTCAAACDTTITISLCWYLYTTPKCFKRTQLLINRLILYTVNTSLWTTTFVLIDLLTFIIWPSNLIFIGVFFLLSKLYTNSFLAILNSRKSLRNTMLSVFSVAEVDIDPYFAHSCSSLRVESGRHSPRAGDPTNGFRASCQTESVRFGLSKGEHENLDVDLESHRARRTDSEKTEPLAAVIKGAVGALIRREEKCEYSGLQWCLQQFPTDIMKI
ncbi:hypothetical protein K439DRAFT_1617233 [Ramaria rubella]|nr:hypothetical protein K439DRAFT_1617233 [Ramaria rubella]